MKRMIVRLVVALCLCAAFAAGCALAEEAADITSKCKFKVSEGDRGNLYDKNIRSMWKYSRADAYVGIHLPKDARAGWLRIEWLYDPKGFELIEYDADLNELRTRDQTCTFPNIYTMLELLPETSYLQLKMTAKNQQIGNLRVYSAGDLPKEVQVWERPVEKADLMVVSTHQDDELIFLGGTIPYYATALKKPTIVMYMANCTRYRRNEALNALWKMGVRDYPEFLNLRDKRVDSINEGIELWGGKDNILSMVVERIRRFKPEVIVTQDLNGEYGHNQHKITARCMMYAIEAAADPAQYADSYNKYGAWQVKKLYHHLYAENQIEMDWETPLDSLNGYTPLKVAQIGMNEHASQLKYYAVKSHGKYDNSKFGLYFTTVGPDEAKNDFLEHIDPDASAKYLAEHAGDAAQTLAAEAPAEAEPVTEVPAGEEPVEELSAEETPAEEVSTEEAPVEAAEEIAEGEAPVEEAPEDAPEAAEAVDEEPAAEAAVEVVTPDAEPAEEATPTGVEPQTANEQGGGNGLAIALVAAGAVALGGGGWYGYRTWSRSRRHRRRRSVARR